MNSELTFIDLFAGCGGLSLGATNAGFKGVLAIEKQKNAFDTLKHNLITKRAENIDNRFDWPENIEISNYDIDEFIDKYDSFLQEQKGKIDLIVGGPPCQGFSTAGKRRKNDPRNKLYKSYLKFVDLVEPKMILIENVSGIASKFNNQGRSYKDNIIDKLKKKYHIGGELLSSEIFGVPQKRKRYFIIGFNKEVFTEKIEIDTIFSKIIKDARGFSMNYELDGERYNIFQTKTYDALSDLDGLESNQPRVEYIDENANVKKYETYEYGERTSDYQKLMRSKLNGNRRADSHRIGEHQPQTIEKYSRLIEISNNSLDRSGHKFSKEQLAMAGWNSKKLIINVLKKNSFAPTITTCPFDYIHYSSPRILTVREFARLQSFPDWFQFKGVYALSGGDSYKTPRYSQIGNAVPPLMAESIIRTLKNELIYRNERTKKIN